MTVSQETPLDSLLKGRSQLKCPCGEEIVAQEVTLDDGRTVGEFVPCKCGSKKLPQIPSGSIFGSFTNNLIYFWGPRETP